MGLRVVPRGPYGWRERTVERAAAIIVGWVGVLVLTIAALFWVTTRDAGDGMALFASTSTVLAPRPSEAGSAPAAAPPSARTRASRSAPAPAPRSSGSATSPVSSTTTAAVSPALADILADIRAAGIRFEYRSAQLTPEVAARLDPLVAALQAEPNVALRIIGYTDSDGGAEENIALGARRAAAVISYLRGAGVDPARLVGVGGGESAPIASNDDPVGRQVNRRVEIELLGPLP